MRDTLDFIEQAMRGLKNLRVRDDDINSYLPDMDEVDAELFFWESDYMESGKRQDVNGKSVIDVSAGVLIGYNLAKRIVEKQMKARP